MTNLDHVKSDGYGHYLSEHAVLEIESRFPELHERWMHWLDAQRDPGNYDYYKEMANGVRIYVSETFMPDAMIKELVVLLSNV